MEKMNMLYTHDVLSTTRSCAGSRPEVSWHANIMDAARGMPDDVQLSPLVYRMWKPCAELPLMGSVYCALAYVSPSRRQLVLHAASVSHTWYAGAYPCGVHCNGM